MNWKFFTAPQAARVLIIAALLITAVALRASGIIDTDRLLLLARGYAENWWLSIVLVLAQIVLYTFALSGSYALWVVAPLYPPVTATVILAIGGTLGAISAYFFSLRLTDKWTRRIENSRVYRLLRQHNNVFTLFALRLLPGFPHGLINYSSGILKARFSHFLPATIAGFTIKFYIYSSIIYKAASVTTRQESLDYSSMIPLVLLSVLSASAVIIKHRLSNGEAAQ